VDERERTIYDLGIAQQKFPYGSVPSMAIQKQILQEYKILAPVDAQAAKYAQEVYPLVGELALLRNAAAHAGGWDLATGDFFDQRLRANVTGVANSSLDDAAFALRSDLWELRIAAYALNAPYQAGVAAMPDVALLLGGP
jgi:hypothetical protein